METALHIDQLVLACASTQEILSNVSREQLGHGTPCDNWTVRDLIEHIVSATDFFGDVAELGFSPDDRDWPVYSGGDFSGSFRDLSGRVVLAFSADGAMERTMRLPTGDHPGATCIQVAIGETFVHGWDLARSTSQAFQPDNPVAEALLSSDWMRMCEEVRNSDSPVFAPEISIDKDAPPVDRLMGFLGRNPRWQATGVQ